MFVDNVVVDEIPQCPPPTTQNIANLAPTSVDLGWTETGTATTWEIEYGITGFTQGTGTIVSTTNNPYSLTGLTAGSTYDWYVRADCGGTYSGWVGANTFSTPNAVTVPYAFGFEVDTKGDWIDDPSTAYSWSLNSGGTGSSGTGPSAASEGLWYVYTETSGPSAGAEFGLYAYYDFSGATAITFEFDYNMLGADMGTLNFQISTDGGATYTTLWTLSGDQGADWHTASVDLSTYSGGSGLLRFLGIRGASYTGDMAVDNMNVYVPLAHNVGTSSIDVAAFMGAGPVVPMATVTNSGTNTETFDVQMDITGGYTSVVTVTALAPGASTQVTFGTWTATDGDYTIDVCTLLGTDMDNTNDCITGQNAFVRTFDKVVYAYAVNNYNPDIQYCSFSFNLNDPSDMTVISTYPSTDNPYSGAWSNSFWYVQDATTYDLTVIDPGSGTKTVIGSTGSAYISGLAWDATTSTMYGIDGTNLYTVDMATGAATIIAALDANLNTQNPVNLACSPGGVLYTVGLGDDVLYTVNKATAVGTAVGPIGYNINFAQDMEFDAETGDLFIAAYGGGGTGNLRWVDLTSGMSYFVGWFGAGAGSSAEVCGFAIPYGYNVAGTLEYADNAATDLDHSTAKLVSGTLERTFTTDCNGVFVFDGVDDGTYVLSGETDKLWGGLNVADIFMVQMVAAGQAAPVWDPIMSPLAADVTMDGNVNVADKFMMQMKNANPSSTPPSWNAPDYIFNDETITVAGGDYLQGVTTICAGDANFSYSPPFSCPDPTGLGATNITDVSADLTWTSNAGNSNLEWGPTGFVPGSGTTVIGVTSPYALTGLATGTGYDFYVQDICCSGTGLSDWAGPYTFTTLAPPPSNDDFCNPIVITVDAAPIAGDNTLATGETWEPAGTCWVGTADNTMWYSFVAPASGNVQINTDFVTGENDCQITLYEWTGGVCTGPTLSELGCGQDEGTTGSGWMAIIDATGLTPGVTYYIQYDGYSTSVGDFLIEVTAQP